MSPAETVEPIKTPFEVGGRKKPRIARAAHGRHLANLIERSDLIIAVTCFMYASNITTKVIQR